MLSLTLHDYGRAWTGFDWDVMNRLHEKGFIDSPAGRAKSVVLTREGLAESECLFEAMFTKAS